MTSAFAHKLPKSAIAIAIALCGATGLGLAYSPLGTTVGLSLVFVLALFFTGSRGFLRAFLLFLLVQDVLQVVAGGDTPVGLLIKRADEPMVLVYGALCLLLSTSVHRSLRERPMVLAIAGCYAGVLLSSIPPMSGLFPAALDLALFSKPFCIFAIGLSLAPGDDEIENWIRPLVTIMLAVVAFGAVFLLAPQLQDAYIGSVRGPDERLGFLSAQGFFIGPATYSWFAAATFCLAYAAYLTYSRTYYMVGSFVAAAFVILSWRRKSILAVLCVLLVSLVVRSLKGSRVRALAVVALSVLVVSTILVPYVSGLWSTTVQEYGSNNPYASARGALYYTATLIAKDHFPLGTGLASFGSHASKLYYSEVYRIYGISEIYGLSPMESHFITDTFWPMVLGEGGIISFIAYCMFFWILLRASWTSARRPDRSRVDSFVALLALFALVGSLIEATASHLYGSSLQATLALLPAGVLWEREQRVRSGSTPIG